MLQHYLGGSILDLFTPVGRGREPIAVNQPSGGGTVYPFIAESDLNTVVADAYLYAVGDGCKYAFPFHIDWLFGFGTSLVFVEEETGHPQDALIVDANGLVVFNTATAESFSAIDWSDRLRVYEWKSAHPERLLRLVQHIAVPLGEDPQNFPKFYRPTFSELDPRVIEFTRPRVRSLRVAGGDQLDRPIVLQAGYNMELSVTEVPGAEGGRNSTVITLDAIPGAGLGRYDPGCTGDPVLRSINGVRPDDQGNVDLTGTSCYRIERPIYEQVGENAVAVLDSTLQFINDCGPCCTCDNFLNTYEAVRRLRDRYAGLVSRAHAARDKYNDNVTRWNEQVDCRKTKAMGGLLQPSCEKDLLLAASYCNQTGDCLHNLVMVFSLQYADEAGDIDPHTGLPFEANSVYSGTSDPTVACGSSLRAGNYEPNSTNTFTRNQPQDYALSGTYPYYYAFWDRISAGALASVMFRLDFPESEASDQVEVIVDAYSLPDDVAMSVGEGSSPIPGYVFGAGPLTAQAKSYRAAGPMKFSSGLLQADCCEQ